MKKPAFLNSKKFRYGSVSTTVTVVFIAMILVFNIIFSTIADRNSWYIDMTDEQVFTLSDSAKSLLDTLEQDVTVIFATDPDKIESDFGSLESGKAMAYIFNTAKLMQGYTKNKEHKVHLEFVDCERNPSYFDQFQNLSAMVATGDSFNSDYVIVKGEDKNGDEPGGFEYGAYKDQNFFINAGSTSQTYCYTGELVFLSAFLQVGLEEDPVVCFTTGHGEDLDLSKYSNLMGMFQLAGFAVRDIDLSVEDIPADTRMLVINDVLFVCDAGGDVDQIQKVSDYLNNVGSVMFFTDYRYAANLPNLNDLLKLWNIEMQSGVYVQDVRHSTGDAAQIIRVDYNNESQFVSQLLTNALYDSFAKPVMSYATPIKILNGGTKEEALRVLTTQGLLVSSESSKTVSSTDSNHVISNAPQTVLAMTYSKMYDEQDDFSSYLLACGSSTFANNAYCTPGASYPNWDILYSFIRTATRYQVPVNIDYKVFQSYDLDITSYQADVWTLVLTVTLPAIAAICGAVILIRRKYA